VKLALKRMHRALGRAQRQAAPVSDALVERLLAAAGTGTRALRNKAMLTVAYTTMARRAEDLTVEADGFGTIVIRRGKTDQEGQGAVAPVTPDAMRHLLAWIEAAGVQDGPLFRAVLKGGRIGGALDAGEVGRVFKAMVRAAGLSPADRGADQRPQHARRRRPGHVALWRNAAGHHADRKMENRRDGRPLHRETRGPPGRSPGNSHSPGRAIFQ
jgi:integrase